MKVRFNLTEASRLDSGIDLYYDFFDKDCFESLIDYCLHKDQAMLFSTCPPTKVLNKDSAIKILNTAYLTRLNCYSMTVDFNGKKTVVSTYEDFLDFVQPNNYTQYKNKIIKFVYNSGSNPGEYRTVKVSDVTRDFITGYDLGATFSGNNNKLEFRKYATKHIDKSRPIQEIKL